MTLAAEVDTVADSGIYVVAPTGRHATRVTDEHANETPHERAMRRVRALRPPMPKHRPFVELPFWTTRYITGQRLTEGRGVGDHRWTPPDPKNDRTWSPGPAQRAHPRWTDCGDTKCGDCGPGIIARAKVAEQAAHRLAGSRTVPSGQDWLAQACRSAWLQGTRRKSRAKEKTEKRRTVAVHLTPGERLAALHFLRVWPIRRTYRDDDGQTWERTSEAWNELVYPPSSVDAPADLESLIQLAVWRAERNLTCNMHEYVPETILCCEDSNSAGLASFDPSKVSAQ